jgi:tetratricopeptide (TPR) repeat protein
VTLARRCPQCGQSIREVGRFFMCGNCGWTALAGAPASEVKASYHEFVWQEFPHPIAIAYRRLSDCVNRGEGVAAAWQLRDCFEVVIKLLAAVGVGCCFSDPRQSTGAPGQLRSDLADILLKPRGLSIGDWYQLLNSVADTVHRNPACGPNELGAAHAVKRLRELLVTARGRASILALALGAGDNHFIAWRNRVFGHGVFRHDAAWYLAEALAWLERYNRLCLDLKPVFSELRLYTDDGTLLHGEMDVGAWPDHKHQSTSLGQSVWMSVRTPALEDAVRINLAPLLSVQFCEACRAPRIHFWDRSRSLPDQRQWRTFFLEYQGGHESVRGTFPGVSGLQAAARHTWNRKSYDADELYGEEGLLTRDFEQEYQAPEFLIDEISAAAQTMSAGYIHVVGEAGLGKSFLARAMMQQEVQFAPTIVYHILAGASSDFRVFITDVADRCRVLLRFRTQEIQTTSLDRPALRGQFRDFFDEVMRANSLTSLCLCLDGLDEISEPAHGEPNIAELLPDASELPSGMFIVLLSRPVLGAKVAGELKRLSKDSSRFRWVPLNNSDPRYLAILRHYLRKRLPEDRYSEGLADTIIDRAGARFLYVFHYCAAVCLGAFTSADIVRGGPGFYETFLGKVRERVGPDLYDHVYLPVLLAAAAAKEPVSLETLASWGLSAADIAVVILDLRDFFERLRVEGQPESQYRIVHADLIRYFESTPVLRTALTQMHAQIGRIGWARHAGQWQEVDRRFAMDRYDLLFATAHLEAGGQSPGGAHDPDFAEACRREAAQSVQAGALHDAVGLLNHGASVWRARLAGGDQHAREKLASVLIQLASVFRSLNNIAQAAETVSVAESILANAASSQLRSQLLLESFRVYELLGDENRATTALHQLITVAQERKDTLALGDAYLNLSWYLHSRRGADALYYGLQGLTLVESSGDARSRVRALLCVGRAYLSIGQLDQAIEHMERAYGTVRDFPAVLKSRDSDDTLRLRLTELAVAYVDAGLPARALRTLRQLREIWPGETVIERLYANVFIARALGNLGQYGEAAQILYADRAELRKTPVLWVEVHTVSCLGLVETEREQWTIAEQLIAEGSRLAAVCHDNWILADDALFLTELALRRRAPGDLELARARAGEALEVARAGQLQHAEIQALSCLGRAFAAVGDFEAAVDYSGSAVKKLEALESLAGFPIQGIWFHHFEILRQGGRETEAWSALDQAWRLVMEQAGNIERDDYRVSFLHGVKVNRDIAAAVERRQLSAEAE